MKEQLYALVNQALDQLVADGTLERDAIPDYVLERTRSPEHGDFACNVAMLLARSARRNPRQLAEAIIAALPASDMVNKVEVAGPGFINLFLTPAAWHAELERIVEMGEAYGRNNAGQGVTVGVEFVSANPTGPLHVGHGRAAILGDCISALLEATGWDVRREYYYNDAGAQIDNLALSVQARARGLGPDDPDWPADGYRGEYIKEVARRWMDGDSVETDSGTVTATGQVDDLDGIRRFAVAVLREEQDGDLKAFGVGFDVYFLESSLYADGMVDNTVAELAERGHSYEEDGALWLRSTDFGDDKDRVMRKSDGHFTYFVPDVAYHWSKWQRGYVRAITELGSDHHGSLARVRAGLQALDVGIPAGWPEYVLHQMVTVTRGGEEVKLSKRAGSYLTLRDLIDEVGRDATRYFLVERKADSQIVFDIDLARSQSNDNPVYYIQYAHARLCSVMEKLEAQGLTFDEAAGRAALDQLEDPHARTLMVTLSRYPEMLAAAAERLEPHAVAQYLRDVAGELHSYYNSQHFLVADATVRNARLYLALATRQVLANGLALLGLDAPQRMAERTEDV